MDAKHKREIQEAIDLAVGYILEQATYYRPNDLPEISMDDYMVVVNGDEISVIHKMEGLQLGNTESLSQWLNMLNQF